MLKKKELMLDRVIKIQAEACYYNCEAVILVTFAEPETLQDTRLLYEERECGHS